MQITIRKYVSEMTKQTNSPFINVSTVQPKKKPSNYFWLKKKKNSHPVFYESPPLLNRGYHELKPLILATVSTCRISVSIP